jgi:MATE family multidrug resistance protein
MTDARRGLAREARAMARLAAPIVAVQLGMMAMGVVDVMMVGHYSADDLAAVALGNIVVFALLGFGSGILLALDPVIAHALGADDRPAARRAVQRGVVTAVLLAVPLSLACFLAEPFLRLLDQPDDITPSAVAYVHWSMAGLAPALLFAALRQSLQANARLTPILWAIVVANAANATLNHALIYGELGAPELGVRGAALASTLSRWILLCSVVGGALGFLRSSLLPWDPRSATARPIARLVRLGLPLGGQFLLEMGAFATTALWMGWIGKVPLAGHQVAINLASVSFMVPVGISAAAAVRVGRAVGAGDESAVRCAAGVALSGGALVMALFGLLFLALPDALASLYTDDLAARTIAASLIPLAGVFQVFDGLQVVAIGVLRGLGETRTAIVVNVIGFWLTGVPIGYLLAFPLGLGARGLWWGLVAGLGAVAVTLALRVAAQLRRELRRIDLDAASASPEVPDRS